MAALILNRRSILASVAALMAGNLTATASSAQQALYSARTIVTGRREETLIPGLRHALREVLVRVSGDPRLAGHPGVEDLMKDPKAAVLHIAYRDLYAFRPIRDEQGTRDRPYELTIEYDIGKIDAILSRLGARPWLDDRPRLVIFLAVRHIGTTYVLDSTIDVGQLQREAFADASWKFAMPVVIPSAGTISKAKLTVETLPATPLATLQALTDTSVDQRALAGTLYWNKKKLAWSAGWRIAHDGSEISWGIDGVNFDAAFRNAVGGAAQILSGNGQPP